jgi:hypothetical protein
MVQGGTPAVKSRTKGRTKGRTFFCNLEAIWRPYRTGYDFGYDQVQNSQDVPVECPYLRVRPRPNREIYLSLLIGVRETVPYPIDS